MGIVVGSYNNSFATFGIFYRGIGGRTMNSRTILRQVAEHIDRVIAGDSELGKELWVRFTQVHPADIAHFFTDISTDNFKRLFMRLADQLQFEVFHDLSDTKKVRALSFMSEKQQGQALNALHPDELTDLFDLLSDVELKRYLQLLSETARSKVLSLRKFDPESAGGIMDTEVLAFNKDFTVEKSIQILQRLSGSIDVYQQIYVTNSEHQLVGHIHLEDLVLQRPDKRISSFMRKNELVARAEEDREAVAKKMVHYSLMTAPVVGEDNHFIGVIPSETLVDVIVKEAREDVRKMSALTPLKHSYFESSFWRMLYERSYILIALLLAQSFSTSIMKAYESTLHIGSLLYFTTMLISTGGNTSNQTSAVVIQGLASGDIRPTNIRSFLKREFMMAGALAVILGITAFGRAYYTTGSLFESCAISGALTLIVLVSVTIGSCIPLILRRLNLDPAFSAGPFLATLMDILGVLIYCYVSHLILG